MIPEFSKTYRERLTLVTLTREQFYNDLWSLTGQELRIRYALSPYGLSLICQRYHLPQPPVGYWTKIRHGTKAKRRSLPELSDPALQHIRLLVLEPDLAECKLNHTPIPVPATLQEEHPLVREIQSSQSAGGDQPAGPEGLAVEFDVPGELKDRALRLLDALIKGFEGAGGRIFVNSGDCLWGRPPDGVGLSVWVSKTPLNPGETPRLAVDITTNRRVGIKGHWADMKTQRVDGSLRPIINSIFETVARVRWERLDNECVARQKERIPALRQRQAEESRAAAEEQEFGRALADEAKRYDEAVVIRKYIRAIRRKLARPPDNCSPAVDENWLRRANRYVDSIDPLAKRFPPHDRGAPLPPGQPVDDLDITGELRLRLAEIGIEDSLALFGLKRGQLGGYYSHQLWEEVCRTLEISGYDITNRTTAWGGYL